MHSIVPIDDYLQTPLIHPDQWAVEIEPDELLASIIQCIKEAIKGTYYKKISLNYSVYKF